MTKLKQLNNHPTSTSPPPLGHLMLCPECAKILIRIACMTNVCTC